MPLIKLKFSQIITELSSIIYLFFKFKLYIYIYI